MKMWDSRPGCLWLATDRWLLAADFWGLRHAPPQAIMA